MPDEHIFVRTSLGDFLIRDAFTPISITLTNGRIVNLGDPSRVSFLSGGIFLTSVDDSELVIPYAHIVSIETTLSYPTFDEDEEDNAS